MLFYMSAAVVGSLVLGYPIILFLNGQKREAVVAVGMTIACMFVATAIIFGIIFVLR